MMTELANEVPEPLLWPELPTFDRPGSWIGRVAAPRRLRGGQMRPQLLSALAEPKSVMFLDVRRRIQPLL